MPIYEVKITTFTRVACTNEEEAAAFAKEALETISFEGIEAPGELHAFGMEDPDVIEDPEPEEEPDMERDRR